MHEAPAARTRALHGELAAAQPLTAGYAVDRACTAPWYSLVRQDMEVVLGVGALERCSSMGKSKWAAFVRTTGSGRALPPALDPAY
jgi:hypothetical protein